MNVCTSNMPRLSQEERSRALGLLDAGFSVRNVARLFNVNHTTISRLRSVADMPRSGRPRCLTDADERYVRIASLRDRFRPATSIANEINRLRPTNVSAQTVRNSLHRACLRARRPEIGIPLSENHRRLRQEWATRHQRWTMARWRDVLFSDESRFNIDFADGRRRTWRRRNERFSRCCIAQRNRYGGGSVMVWGAISWNHRTELVVINGNLNAQQYCNQILHPHVIPFIRRYGQRLVFQQDNARPHTARATQQFLQTNNIAVLPRPARSPDLLPFEHVWDILGRNVRSRHNARNIQELGNALQIEWNAIPQNDIRNVIGSMRRRCNACVQAGGGHTRY